MKRRIIIAITLTMLVVAIAFSLATSVIGKAAAAGPTLQTPTTGQPGSSNGVSCGMGTATVVPGGSGTSQAPFNGAGQADQVYAGNPNTASLANSNSSAAVSQYDVACLQFSTHP